jgi:hypothetical protein
MYGEMPTSPVVFAACDSKYFLEHAAPLIYSASEIGKKDVHVHIVNPTDDAISLAGVLNATTKQRVTYTYNDMEFPDWTPEMIRAYYASLRFLVAPHILQTCGAMLILDIDCMVMQEFDYPAKPIGFFPRESLPGTVGWEAEGTKVAAGAVYYHKNAFEVAAGVADELSKLPLQWFNDQIALSNTFNKVQQSDVFHHFDGQFMDWEFNEGSVIWTGKGSRKYDNVDYVSKKNYWNESVMNKCAGYTDVILKPRLDIPFKKFGCEVANKGTLPAIRQHWQNFIDKIKGPNTLIVESPRWTFNVSIQKYFGKKPMLVPHVERHSWGGHENTKYYMQTVFPWLFTVDPEGWAGGSKYLEGYNKKRGYSDDAFKSMQSYIAKGSKFQELQADDVDWSKIEKDNYIIVPLQLPHDDTIRWHSDFSVEHFVKQICEWAKTQAPADCPQIVFKGHPVNLGSMKPLKDIIEQWTDDTGAIVYIERGNFQELVRNAKGMFVLNGGSGQEAMLLEKPVVAFGRCDYAPAVLNGDIEEVGAAYEAMKSDKMSTRIKEYQRWFDWYLNAVTVDSRKK